MLNKKLYKWIISICFMFGLLFAGVQLNVAKDNPHIVVYAETNNSIYYGRSQLTIASQINAYDAICNAVANRQTTIALDSFNLSYSDFQKVYEFYCFDHTEHYWIPKEYHYSTSAFSGKVLSMELAYLTGFNNSLFESEVNNLLSVTNGLTTDYAKALALHDALVNSVTYDLSASNIYNCYGAIVGKRAVCEGYAEAYQYLLQRCGIQSYIVTGTSRDVLHEWNLVRLNNKYYYTDLTWDDQEGDIFYSYFNIPTKYLIEDHEIIDTYNVLPNCVDEDMMYTDMAKIGNYTINNVSEAINIVGNIGTAELFFTGVTDNFTDWIQEGNRFRQIINNTGFAHAVGSFSYGILTCGRENILKITGPIVHATSITLNKNNVTLIKDSSDTLVASVTPSAYCSDIIVWSSNNMNVVEVDNNGRIIAKNVGNAVITATAGNKSVNCTITVRPECEHLNKTHHDSRPSTCIVAGWNEYYVCDDCGMYIDLEDNKTSELQYLPLADHAGGTANCHQKAVCSVCGVEYGDLNPTHHDGDTELHNQISATCTKTGFSGDTYCKGCGVKIASGSSIAKSDHSFSDTYVKENADKNKHYYVCTVCGVKDSGESHAWNIDEPTEDEDKHCEICNYVIATKLGHLHSGVYHDGIDPTCTQNGSRGYYSCACGKYFENIECSREIENLTEWGIILAGHDYLSPQWIWSEDYENVTAKFVCSLCDDEKIFDASITSEITNNGKRKYTAVVEFDGEFFTDEKVETSRESNKFSWESVLELFSFGGAINSYLGLGIVVAGLLLVSIVIIKVSKRRHRE